MVDGALANRRAFAFNKRFPMQIFIIRFVFNGRCRITTGPAVMMDIEQLGRIAGWLAGLLHWTGESLAMDETRLCLLTASIAVSIGQALHCNNTVPCCIQEGRMATNVLAGDTARHAFVSGKAGTAKGFSLG